MLNITKLETYEFQYDEESSPTFRRAINIFTAPTPDSVPLILSASQWHIHQTNYDGDDCPNDIAIVFGRRGPAPQNQWQIWCDVMYRGGTAKMPWKGYVTGLIIWGTSLS